MKTNSIVSIRRRLTIALVVVFLSFCIILGRLFFVQIVIGDSLSSRATSQWYRDLPLKAKRGTIYDRNGNAIVDSKEVFTVYIRPQAVTDAEKVSTALATALSLDKNKLLNKIKSSKVGEITVKKGVEFSLGNELRNQNLNGVYFSVDSARNYPYSDYLAQVVGYTNIDNEGQNGLEGYYDKFLRGVNGVSLTETDNKGKELEERTTRYLPSITGANLVTGLDLTIQGFVESAVRSAKIEWNAKRTSMLVMEVDTGAITAMAFSPSYDMTDIPRNDINMLNAYSKNSMITDVYEPGSTFKIFTTALALEKGVVSEKNSFFCPGYRVVDGNRIKCWRTIGHGTQTLGEGVKNSCNCVFMDLAQKLGTDSFYDGLKKFGFGQKTGVDFYSESIGLLMNQKAVKTVDLARIGFGQAIAVTPLQLLSGVCTVANGGKSVTPHFVNKISDSLGNEIYSFSSNEKRVLSAKTSETMCNLLEKVVSEGSGKKASVVGYQIAGKTGTAQKYEDGAIAQGKYISSFVGFAPAKNPKYAILMIVDEPNSYAYYGSIVSAPFVGQVFSKIFEYEKILPSVIEGEQEYTSMPFVEGLSVASAIEEIKKANLKCEIAGEGEKVVVSVPYFGEKVKKGDIVLLRTE